MHLARTANVLRIEASSFAWRASTVPGRGVDWRAARGGGSSATGDKTVAVDRCMCGEMDGWMDYCVALVRGVSARLQFLFLQNGPCALAYRRLRAGGFAPVPPYAASGGAFARLRVAAARRLRVHTRNPSMQLFWLAATPEQSAALHCDGHMTSQPREGLQISRSSLDISERVKPADMPIASTHHHHPCVLWCAAHRSHLALALALSAALFAEHTARYGTVHKYIKEKTFDAIADASQHAERRNSIPGDAPPDRSQLEQWLREYESRCATSGKRKRGSFKPMSIATVDLPDGVRTLPLAFDEEFFVHDDNGNLCGIASYRNYYLRAKLLGDSNKKTMRTIRFSEAWPEPFTSLALELA